MEHLLSEFSLYKVQFDARSVALHRPNESTLEMTDPSMYGRTFCKYHLKGKQFFRFFAHTKGQLFNAGVSQKPQFDGCEESIILGFRSGQISHGLDV